MEILRNFGIQPILLAAQIVNFLIIVFLLKRFFYKPITKALGDRQKRIEESLKNADLIEENLKKTEEKSAQILEEATKGAQSIIADAKEEAERITANTMLEARKTTQEIIEKAKLQINQQRQAMQRELEKETLGLVIEVVQKVLSKHLAPGERKSLTTRAISEIKQFNE